MYSVFYVHGITKQTPYIVCIARNLDPQAGSVNSKPSRRPSPVAEQHHPGPHGKPVHLPVVRKARVGAALGLRGYTV